MTKKELTAWANRLAALLDAQSAATDEIDAMLVSADETGIRGQARTLVVRALVALGWSKTNAYLKVQNVLGSAYATSNVARKPSRKSAAKRTISPAEIVQNKPKLSKFARRIEVMIRGLRKPDREALLAYLAR